jgi:single-strand DNA-binding protein
MANFNKVTLIGNCTRDPEVRYTPKGTAVAELGLAINRYYKADNGDKREETTFVDVTLWGRTAEIAGEYCKKGKPVFIEGRLQLDTWDDKNTGQKRSKLKVVGDNLQLLGGREGGAGGGGGGGGGYQQGSGSGGSGYQGGDQPQQQQPQQQAPPQQQQPQGNNDGAQFEDDDDIPF